MPTLSSRISDVQAALDTLARQHKVPGASLGIMSGDETVEFVTGVANLRTGVPVTNDTIFQIGSNTKVFVATMIMQLVDQGKVDLDAPVRKYLPEFSLTDSRAAGSITVRQLLTHTSGIDAADYFEDFGLGDESLEKFVESLAQFGQVYAPGDMWSYNNSAFALAGRIIEKLTELPFREAFHSKLLDPLRLKDTTVRVQDMLVRHCAVGHITPPGAKEPVVTPTPLLPIATAAAGAITSSTPRDMLAFVRMHLNGGRGPDANKILSESSVRAMQQAQTKIPRGGLGEEMGIGWILATWDGERVLRHGGGTVGQLSSLYVLPDRRFSVVLLTNSDGGLQLWRDLGKFVFEEFTGVKMPDLPKPPPEPQKVEPRRYVGTYQRCHMETVVKVRDGELVGSVQYKGPLRGESEPQEFAMRPIDDELFQTVSQGVEGTALFMDFDGNGRARYVHMGGRVSRRATDGTSRSRRKTKPKAKAAKRTRSK